MPKYVLYFIFVCITEDFSDCFKIYLPNMEHKYVTYKLVNMKIKPIFSKKRDYNTSKKIWMMYFVWNITIWQKILQNILYF